MESSRGVDKRHILSQIEQLQRNADVQREGLAKLKSAVEAQWPESVRPSQEQTDSQAQLETALGSLCRCTARLIDLATRTSSKTNDNPRYFSRPGLDLLQTRHQQTRVVELTIFWIPTNEESNQRQRGHIVIQRTASYGPPQTCMPLDGKPGKDHSTARDLQDAFDGYVAKKLVAPTWERYTQVWVTPVCKNVAAATEQLSSLRDQWHNLVLGEPVQSIGTWVNLDSASVDVLTGIATELPLPGDPLIKDIKRLLQCAGIIIGVVAGHPLLVNACVKSLVHDLIFQAVRDVIQDAIENALNQAGVQELYPRVSTREDLEAISPHHQQPGPHPHLAERVGSNRKYKRDEVDRDPDGFEEEPKPGRRIRHAAAIMRSDPEPGGPRRGAFLHGPPISEPSDFEIQHAEDLGQDRNVDAPDAPGIVPLL
jgi:hypothetical protein